MALLLKPAKRSNDDLLTISTAEAQEIDNEFMKIRQIINRIKQLEDKIAAMDQKETTRLVLSRV